MDRCYFKVNIPLFERDIKSCYLEKPMKMNILNRSKLTTLKAAVNFPIFAGEDFQFSHFFM